MEVPQLLADAGLVAISTAAVFFIFFIRRFFIKSCKLETSIKQLDETVNKLRSDEEAHNNEHKALDTRFKQVTGHLETQHELIIEVGKSITDTEETLKTLVTNNEESQYDTSDKFRKILRCHEQLNEYFSNLDEDIITKIGQVDTTLTNIFTKWECQLEPFITTSNTDHHNLREDFVKLKLSFQELADNVCRELSECNQRIASASESIAEHRDQYARDRRLFTPNHHRPYGRDTRSQRGLLRQATYESRCGSHGHENHSPRRDYGPVRQEPQNRPLVGVMFDEDDEY